MVEMPPLDPPELGLMLTPRRELVSTDVAIGGMTVEDGFDPAWPNFHGHEITGWSWFPVHPTRYVYLDRRAIVFRPRANSMTTTLYQWDLRWKQDPGLAEPLRVGWLEPDASHVLHRADGSQEPLAGRDTRQMHTTWHPGEHLVSWTDGRRPALFINRGVPVELTRDDENEGRLALEIAPAHLPTTDTVATIRMVGVGGTYDDRDPDTVDRMRHAMGLAGEPDYQVDVEAGRVVSRELLLELDANRRGVACRIPRAELPMALPVLVQNVNANWPVFLVDRDQRRWRPLGVLAAAAYATVDTGAQDWSLFIGHPVHASDARVVLSLAQTAPDRWMLEVHNPTPDPVTVAVEPSPWFDLLDWAGATYELGAGASVFEPVAGATAHRAE